MMLTNNMSARLDAVDKLLRVVSGQETGLDRAMLQETRSVVTGLTARWNLAWKVDIQR